MTGAALLVVLERGHRGTAEVQFADSLYVCRGLHRQLGGIDLLLRGSSVTFGVDTAPVPPVSIGDRLVHVPDRTAAVRALLDDGVRVWVDERDLRSRGFDTDRLIGGVLPGDTAALAATWSDYQGVWFL